MKNVILSTSIRFADKHDVLAYSGLTDAARPRLDVEFTEATKIVVGFQHVVLFGATGHRMAVLSRKDYVGMAIDGNPAVITGDEFKPFTVDEAAEEAELAAKQLDFQLGSVPADFEAEEEEEN